MDSFRSFFQKWFVFVLIWLSFYLFIKPYAVLVEYCEMR